MDIHHGLPRQAPGLDATTLYLYKSASSPRGTALDIGCGPGRSTLVLAKEGLDVIALDTHQPFLDELEAAAKKQGLDTRITTRNTSIDTIDYADMSFDLIWSEGAAYIIGWDTALKKWKRLLRPSGTLVATEICWLVDNPSREPKEFWETAYPSMYTMQDAYDIATAQGYTVKDAYVLPKNDWFDEYYMPLKERHRLLEARASQTLREAIAVSR